MTTEQFKDQLHQLTVKSKYEAYCQDHKSADVYRQAIEEYNRVFNRLVDMYERSIGTIIVRKDGDQWFFCFPEFVNLQESEVFFTPIYHNGMMVSNETVDFIYEELRKANESDRSKTNY